jgi:hypothetical protein
MPDDDAKPEPVRFPVVVEVNHVKVEVVLLLRPGTAVTVAETKTTTKPESPRDDG